MGFRGRNGKENGHYCFGFSLGQSEEGLGTVLLRGCYTFQGLCILAVVEVV